MGSVRFLVVFTVIVVVANSLPGYATHPPPVPLAGTSYCVTQGSTKHVVDPVERGDSVGSWYDYFSASGHDPFVEAYASVLYLYQDTTTGRLYFVFHFNVDDGGSTDGSADVTFTGIPAGAGVAVSDDPGEFSLSRTPQGQFQYFLNTDGGALGPLPTSGAWTLDVTLVHFGPDPARSQKWVDGDATRLALSMTGTVHISSVCNQAPTANAGGPYTGTEGSPITFNAGASSDPDGDPLTYTWDFENDGTPDITTTNATVQHTYPDDFVGKAKLTVSDGSLSASTTVNVTVLNVAPTITLDSVSRPLEGGDLVVEFRVTDPGADPVVVVFEAGDLTTPVVVGNLWNPQDVPVTATHVYGDNGQFPIRITATDDDGGNGTLSGVMAVVDNAPPRLLAGTFPSSSEEGNPVTLTATAQDPGSDDLSFAVDFGNGDSQSAIDYNNGVGPDPPISPGGTFPFTATESFTTRYVQNGDYLATLTARDDDGGEFAVPFPIHVRNVAPTILPFGPALSVEGLAGTIAATATDPGDDALTFTWTFELGPTVTETLPSTGSPTTQTSAANFLYGDDGSFAVTLTVTDQDGASTSFTTTVDVANLPPTAQITQIRQPVSLGLRVAGEKWHDVNATFFANDTILGFASVVRTPGSPDDQMAATGFLDLPMMTRYSAKVLYTPADDPVNGQPNGANPAWIVLRDGTGAELRVHHTFNVEHPGTYEWDVALTPYVARMAFRLSATATDAGSDDLTFRWDFADGSPIVETTAFNNGVSADPLKSPFGTFPFVATSDVFHAFADGTHLVRLEVLDDDGGSVAVSVTIVVQG